MNGAETVNWLPAIAVLMAGLVAAVIVVAISRSRRAKLSREREIEPVTDLEQQRDLLIARLRAMKDATPAERLAVEKEAAGVLRRIDETRQESLRLKQEMEQDEDLEEGGEEVRVSRLGGFLWGAGAAAVLGLIIIFVMNSATERGEGGSVTGGSGMSAAPQQQQSAAMSPEVRNLEEWIARNPDDLDARLELARVYIMQQELMKVWDQTQFVLERAPGHPRAIAYQAVVRLAMGQTDVALQMLEGAVEADPTMLDARIHLALAYLQLGRSQEAVQALEEAKKIHPNQAAMIDELLKEVMQIPS